jgi:hypothetical protein
MRTNPTAELLERRMEDRRYAERIDSIDRRVRIAHFRHADIRRTNIALGIAA